MQWYYRRWPVRLRALSQVPLRVSTPRIQNDCKSPICFRTGQSCLLRCATALDLLQPGRDSLGPIVHAFSASSHCHCAAELSARPPARLSIAPARNPVAAASPVSSYLTMAPCSETVREQPSRRLTRKTPAMKRPIFIAAGCLTQVSITVILLLYGGSRQKTDRQRRQFRRNRKEMSEIALELMS
jgi:hypothetical protein